MSAERQPELPDSPNGWLELLSNIDYRNHKKAMLALGAAAAVGLGVGVYAISKKRGGGTFFVSHGDRHMQQKGVVSLGEIREHGVAVSVPEDETALDGLAGDHAVFSMDQEGMSRPMVNEDGVPLHVNAIRKMVDLVRDQFQQRAEPGQPEQ